MFEKVKDKLHLRQVHREIDKMSAAQLKDLGVHRDELRLIVGVDGAINRRQTAMAALHDLDADDLNRDRHELAMIVRTCRDCRSVAKCEQLLADPDARAQDAEFCPNHAEYRSLSGQHST